MILLACNVMVEANDSFYTLSNHGTERNCTLMAAFPAVVTVEGIKVGGNTETVNYDVSRKIRREKFGKFTCYSHIIFLIPNYSVTNRRSTTKCILAAQQALMGIT